MGRTPLTIIFKVGETEAGNAGKPTARASQSLMSPIVKNPSTSWLPFGTGTP